MSRCSFITTVIILLAAAETGLAAEPQSSDASREWPDGQHRLDFSYTHHDSGEASTGIFLPGYTFHTTQFRFGVTASYINTELEISLPDSGELIRERESGWGDTRFVVQWDPSDNLTANPWVPDQLGLFGIVTAPTGDAGASLGIDTWQLEIGFGAPIFLTETFVLLPSGYYHTNFLEEIPQLREEEVGGTLGLYFLLGERFWIGYEPTVAYNTTLNSWATDHRLVVGKLFRSGIGLGLEAYRRERVDLLAVQDDYIWQFNLYYVFGN